MKASVSILKRVGLINLFSGLRFSIGRHVPFFFGVTKNVDQNLVVNGGKMGVMAPLCRRPETSPRRASFVHPSWGRTVGVGVEVDGGVAVN